MTMHEQLRFNRQSAARFLLTQFSQLGFFYALWYVLFPEVFSAQIKLGALALLIAFLLTHLMWCFWEFFFHRYVLHLHALPFLGIFEKKHRAHHDLTYVRKGAEQGGDVMVENRFPILTEPQRKHSVFPWYTLATFFVIGTPILFFVQWLIPSLPILFSGYIAIFVSYVGYEVIHAFEHRSYELWWKPRIERRKFGVFWKTFYAFHVNHHAVPRTNESISGFLGFPLADLLFGTYKRSTTPLINGAVVPKSDFDAPRPYLVVRSLDRVALYFRSTTK